MSRLPTSLHRPGIGNIYSPLQNVLTTSSLPYQTLVNATSFSRGFPRGRGRCIKNGNSLSRPHERPGNVDDVVPRRRRVFLTWVVWRQRPSGRSWPLLTCALIAAMPVSISSTTKACCSSSTVGDPSFRSAAEAGAIQGLQDLRQPLNALVGIGVSRLEISDLALRSFDCFNAHMATGGRDQDRDRASKSCGGKKHLRIKKAPIAFGAQGAFSLSVRIHRRGGGYSA